MLSLMLAWLLRFFNSMVAPQFATEALLETISHKAKGIEKRRKRIDKYLDALGKY